jgi:Xaa-Pro aminopeptidase
MRQDLDRLMAQTDLDGLWISGHAGDNPALDYFVGGAHLTHADLFKKRGEPPILYHRRMERDEAERTGLRTALHDEADYARWLESTGGDSLQADALRIRNALQAEGMSGRIAVLGRIDAGYALDLVRHLEALAPESSFMSDGGDDSVLARARATKDPSEIERIRLTGRITVEVVEQIARFLRARPVEGSTLLTDDRSPLTVGAVKRRIHLLLAERGAESPSGPIFAIGREGAIGHSVGLDDDLVELGRPIVFDIYPRLIGGGYYFDFTRTWCLGFAPEPVQTLYDQVLTVYYEIFPMMVAGGSPKQIQVETCRRFEAQGHPTLLSDMATEQGYFHGLAHGLGLAIHEPPFFRHTAAEDAYRLQPGMVVTFEPGLYYPDQDMGVRLEDTLLITEKGPAEVLVPYPHDLVLPMTHPVGSAAHE